MNEYRTGIIGCGNIGSKYDENRDLDNVYTHAGMVHQTPGLKLVAATDIDQQRLFRCGQYWGVDRLYHDYLEMLREEELELVCIATPDETHRKILLDIQNYSSVRLVLSEKPIAQTSDHAKEIVSASRKSNSIVLVDYIRRWDANHVEVREIIKRKSFGDIQSIYGSYVRGLRHNGCQMVNLLRFFFGEILAVQAFGPLGCGSNSEDPSISFHTVFKNGIPATIFACDQKGYGFSIFELDIMFCRGRIRIVDGGQQIELFNSKKSDTFNNFSILCKDNHTFPESSYGQAMLNAGRDIVNILQGQSTSMTNTIFEAYSDMKIIDCIFESGLSGNSIIDCRGGINESFSD